MAAKNYSIRLKSNPHLPIRFDYEEHDLKVKKNAAIILKDNDIVAVFPHSSLESLIVEEEKNYTFIPLPQ